MTPVIRQYATSLAMVETVRVATGTQVLAAAILEEALVVEEEQALGKAINSPMRTTIRLSEAGVEQERHAIALVLILKI